MIRLAKSGIRGWVGQGSRMVDNRND